MQVSISLRYARALHEVASADGLADQVLSELEKLSVAIDASDEFRTLLDSPMFSRKQRRGVLETFGKEQKFSEVTLNFLRVCADRDRGGQLTHIARVYRDIADEAAGRVRASVSTPYPLSKDEQKQLTAALARATGKTIELQTSEDPSLLGGIVAKVGNRLFDGSLKTQLELLRKAAER